MMTTTQKAAAAAAITGAALVGVMAGGDEVDVTEPRTVSALVEVADTMRQLGASPAAIRADLSALLGVPAADLDPIVGATHGRDRDPSTLRTETVAVAYSLAEAPVAGQAWALALCEPLAVLPALSDRHIACVASQSTPGGAPACIDGGPVGGYVVEMPATVAQAARLRAALTGLAAVGVSGQAVREARGWTACPDGG